MASPITILHHGHESKYTDKINTILDEYQINHPINPPANTRTHCNYINTIATTYISILNDKNNNTTTTTSAQLAPLYSPATAPLILYNIFKDTHKDYNKFLKWYRETSPTLDLRRILKTNENNNPEYSTYYKTLFNPSDKNRTPLHRLLYDNLFIPFDIICCGEIFPITYKHYVSKNKDGITDVDINVYMIDNDNTSASDFDINIVVRIIEFFRRINKANDVQLTIFYCDQKKYLPLQRGDMITTENINSGCTHVGEYIYVWRKEECYKVLIHELIHYFSMDFHEYNYEVLGDMLRDVIHIDGKDVANEAYTEILAVTINSMMIGINASLQSWQKIMSEVIARENLYTHMQVAKIIYHFGGTKYDDLFKITIKQNTSLASYIIAKGALLYNYPMVMKYFDGVRDLDNFEVVYRDALNNMFNRDVVNAFLRDLDKFGTGFARNTLRMTISEI